MIDTSRIGAGKKQAGSGSLLKVELLMFKVINTRQRQASYIIKFIGAGEAIPQGNIA